MLLEAAVPMCFTKELLFKMLQNLQKIPVLESIFNKVRLTTLAKRPGAGVFGVLS